MSAEDAYMENLASRILDMVDISKADIDFMADEQRFARHPNLALAYYHLCSLHPDAFVFNDECLNGEEGEQVCKRLMEAIGPPIGKTEAVQCQESATSCDPATGQIAACASCNEILFEQEHYTGRNPSTFRSGWTSPQGIILSGR